VNPIPVEDGQKLYLKTTIPDDVDQLICFVFVDDNGNYVSQSVRKRSTSGYVSVSVANGAKFLHIWMDLGYTEYGFANWCVTFEPVDKFEPYTPIGVVSGIKPEALPPELFDDDRPLAGKTIVNFGDSIFGKRRPPNDISTEIARLTGATVHNCGFGGCRMSAHRM
jgi:hypothetical protein